MPELGEIQRGTFFRSYTDSLKYIWHACSLCGKQRWVLLKAGQPKTLICRTCNGRLLTSKWKREKHPFWKGGRHFDGDGYIRILLKPDDFFYPMAKKGGYVLEHRLVVAKALGRCLQPWEIVHHKDGCAKDDNRYPETLQLVTDDRHRQITILENRIKRLESRVLLLEVENVALKTELILKEQNK